MLDFEPQLGQMIEEGWLIQNSKFLEKGQFVQIAFIPATFSIVNF
jgi:hypothetical protein